MDKQQCPTLSLSKARDRKITTWDMRCLRLDINSTRRNRIRSADFRKIVGAVPYIQLENMKWFCYNMRIVMPSFHAPKKR
jgi:hypothetical protein